MRYGRTVEPGFLPVFSVDTEAEARALLVSACPTNLEGEFIAPHLAEEQTLENLDKFSDFLQDRWDQMQAHRKATSSPHKPWCRCGHGEEAHYDGGCGDCDSTGEECPSFRPVSQEEVDEAHDD